MTIRTTITTALLFGAMVIGCAETPETEPAAQEDQALLDRITDECAAPREWLELMPGGEVQFQPGDPATPATDAEIEKIGCILDGLRDSGTENIGFIGNDVLPNEIESQ